MDNKTSSISSTAASFSAIHQRFGPPSIAGKLKPKSTEDSISDSLETGDSQSQGTDYPHGVAKSDEPRGDDDSNETGSILDISG